MYWPRVFQCFSFSFHLCKIMRNIMFFHNRAEIWLSEGLCRKIQILEKHTPLNWRDLITDHWSVGSLKMTGAALYFSFLNWVEKKLKYLFCEGFCNTVTFFIKSETLTVNVTLCAFNLVLSITIIHQESSLDELNEVDNWRHHQDHKLVPPHLVDTRHDRWHICCFLVHPQNCAIHTYYKSWC